VITVIKTPITEIKMQALFCWQCPIIIRVSKCQSINLWYLSLECQTKVWLLWNAQSCCCMHWHGQCTPKLTLI